VRWVASILLVLAANGAAAQTHADLFDDTRLQDLHLIVNERDWDDLRSRADENTYYPADLRWNGLTARNIGIRSRGYGTRSGIKPGLRLDINRYLADQRFVGLTALVLDNVLTDPSTMRERLSMKLFARLGLVAVREAHVRLFVNGVYAGLYVLVEAVDRTFVERLFGPDEAHVEDGGYLYEYRWTREYGFEYLGQGLAPYAQLFEPRTRETDAPMRLYLPLEELIRDINEVPLDRFEAEVGARLDLRQFVRILAVQNAAGEIDGLVGNWGLSNFYLYRFRNGEPAQLIPWDADHAFWNPNMPVEERLETNVLTRRTMEIPALRRLYFETLMEASRAMADRDAAGDSRGWLEREVDRLETLVAAAAAADPVMPFSFEEFRGNISDLRIFLRSRPSLVYAQAVAAVEQLAASPAAAHTAR
jgi:spore coat protein CotH